MNLKNIFVIFFILMLSITSEIFAFDNSVATVLLIKGKVKAKLNDGTQIDIKLDQTLPEGAEIITYAKSFIKLIFIDKSTINLGPSSSMLIQAFPKNEAGIIKLIKGQMRAEVTKNYMEMDDKSKSKLYIQTKSSAMGIRGTDFQVNYNPVNQNSSLIVFEGKVVMAHIDRANQNEVFEQKKLEMLVSNSTAVLVRQGQISAVNLAISDRALVPTKLAPKQLDALKENKTGLDEDTKNKKQFRDIVPPGVDSAVFINVSPDIIKAEAVEAKGFFNDKTHEYKPSAGAIIDLKTVNIIAPPPDSKFDHATKTFVIADNFGKVDERSGQFKAPNGYELSSEGQFQPSGTDQNKGKVDKRIEQRTADSRPDVKESNSNEVPVAASVSTRSVVPTDSTTANTSAPTVTRVDAATSTDATAPQPVKGASTATAPTASIAPVQAPTRIAPIDAQAPINAPPPIIAAAPINAPAPIVAPPPIIAPTPINAPNPIAAAPIWTNVTEPTPIIVSPPPVKHHEHHQEQPPTITLPDSPPKI
ncbi:MAG: FecR domain-containing protein [Bacteriovorax sp.]|nr:FecR domain-containing protein [Bacteriovorax sp.]